MSEQVVKYRNSCRLCGARDVRRFLHFDSIPFFDELVTVDRLGTEFLAPMDVYWCAVCKSVQTQHDVDTSAYYVDYQYVASDSAFIRRYMKQLAAEVFGRFGLRPGDHVIEIGSADGYQLSCFQQLGATVLGFEPAKNLCALSEARGVPVVPNLFTSATVGQIPEAFRHAEVIVLLHAFDHLLDPVPFLEVVRNTLDPDRGVLILEVHDLQEIIGNRETSLFGHEHATFLHLASMNRLLERCGLTLLDADIIPASERRGSSMLVAAGIPGSVHSPKVKIDPARYAYLDEWSTYEEFARLVYASFDQFRGYVQEQCRSGKKIAGYGAWGRGSTTLAMARLTAAEIAYVCDRNPVLHGRYTPGSQIPVSAPERVYDDPPDELIVFNHGYFEEIREQLARYISAGGRLTSVIDLLAAGTAS